MTVGAECMGFPWRFNRSNVKVGLIHTPHKTNMSRTLCLLSLAVLLTAGCKSYVDESAGRTAGEVIDDVSIKLRVKAALVNDEELSGFRIKVDVDKGVVRLRGKIERPELRQRALKLVREVRGVVDIVDKLVLVESKAKKSPGTGDHESQR